MKFSLLFTLLITPIAFAADLGISGDDFEMREFERKLQFVGVLNSSDNRCNSIKLPPAKLPPPGFRRSGSYADKKCASVREGKAVFVDRWQEGLMCDKADNSLEVDTRQKVRAKYIIEKKDGRPRVRLYINYKRKESRDKKYDVDLAHTIQQATTCVADYYASQGISMKIYYQLDGNSNAPKDTPERYWNDLTITNNKQNEQSSHEEIFIQTKIQTTNKGSVLQQESANRICGTFSHEIGHMLGLGDWYQTKECPDRPKMWDDSIMNSSRLFPSTIVYDSQLDRIIEPLCGK